MIVDYIPKAENDAGVAYRGPLTKEIDEQVMKITGLTGLWGEFGGHRNPIVRAKEGPLYTGLVFRYKHGCAWESGTIYEAKSPEDFIRAVRIFVGTLPQSRMI